MNALYYMQQQIIEIANNMGTKNERFSWIYSNISRRLTALLLCIFSIYLLPSLFFGVVVVSAKVHRVCSKKMISSLDYTF